MTELSPPHVSEADLLERVFRIHLKLLEIAREQDIETAIGELKDLTNIAKDVQEDLHKFAPNLMQEKKDTLLITFNDHLTEMQEGLIEKFQSNPLFAEQYEKFIKAFQL